MRERRRRGTLPSAEAQAIADHQPAPDLAGLPHACGGRFRLARGLCAVTIRGDTVRVTAEHYACSGCGEQRFDLDQLDRARRAAATAHTKADGLLLPDQIRALREQLGLTQDAFEDALGLGRKTMVRWETGKVLPSQAMALLLLLIQRDPSAMRFLADRAARGRRKAVSARG